MKKDVYELTNPQKSIWLTEQFYSNTTVNNLCGSTIISNKINFDILKKSINMFLKNNDGLRLQISLNEFGNPIQYVNDYSEKEFILNEIQGDEELKILEEKLVSSPFTILDSQLYDIQLFKFPNEFGGFIVKAHHLICDACTAGLIASDIMDIYNELLNNRELVEFSTSYLDFINSEQDYLNSEKFTKDQIYWNTQFSSVPELGIIPSVKNCTNSSCTATRKTFLYSKNNLEKINTFCSNNRVSIFNFFMAVYAIYVNKVSNLDDFVLGTPVLNRTTFKEKNTPGMFISTVPIRFNIKNSLSFIEFVRNIATDSLSIFRHQKYPYQNILERVRESNPSQPNLYDILISYQNTRTNRNSCAVPYKVRWTFNKNTADSIQIHLFDMNDEGLLNISYDYRTNKYDEEDISNIHNRICYIIEQILSNESINLSDIEITTEFEKNTILNIFNQTELTYDKNETIIDLFEEQVSKSPNKIAIIFENQQLTYKELNEKANQLAHYLIKKDLKHNDIIGLMVKRSPEMIIGLIAILKIGAAYLPIDPEYPIDRIKYMLNDSEAKNILVHNKTKNLLSNLDLSTIDISLTSNIFQEESKENLHTDINKEDLIYMIYTSGSTGNPKGVMIKHGNITNFILGEKQYINFSPEKTMVSVTTMCFDIFALEIWCSLSSGMKVVIANETEQMIPSALKQLCEKNNVDMIQTTPSRFSIIFSDNSIDNFFDNFTDIMVGGEPFPKTLLEKFKENTKAKIFNMYGPTETTVWSTIKDLTNNQNITIGTPIANTTCYILDSNKKLLPIGVPGELYIGGDGVTKGYWNRPDLTNEKFIKSPFKENEIIYNTGDLACFDKNGEIIHLGRTDFQVKIRGYRIELEEIQNKLLTFEEITDCVVVSKDNKFLICYYVANEEYSSSSISSYLLESLPNYMVPTYYIKLDSLPLTSNGKLNRKLLPDIEEKEKEIVLASKETEIKITDVISNILNITNIDINTPFLDLGLDSLGIIKAQTMLLKYNLNLSTQDFYKYSTIKKLAEKIDSNIYNYQEQDIKVPDEFKHKQDEMLSKISSTNKEEDSLNNVLLTGANGFVGIHVLYELLNNTNNNIFCLVRGTDTKHSLDRLQKAYNFYFNVDITQYLNTRIYIISGDIADTKLGINPSLLKNYINNFSTIIHTAAIVKHYGNFDDFEKININGTKNIAEFAYTNNKKLIHISSISVSGNYLVRQNNRDIEFSENSLYIGQHYNENVYVNSKLEAEKIILSYMQKGLVAQIHRIGILSGRITDGVFQEKISENAFYNRIKSMISLGSISEEMLNQLIEFTPVDSCAKAIVTLAKNSTCDNKIFHLYNHNLIQVDRLVNLLENLNIHTNILSTQDFNNFIYEKSLESNGSELSSIINDIIYDSNNLLSLNYNFTININSDFTQKYLYLLGFEWPIIDEEYIVKILNYMKKVKFI